jgi:hypothetical protein
VITASENSGKVTTKVAANVPGKVGYYVYELLTPRQLHLCALELRAGRWVALAGFARAYSFEGVL